MIASNRLCRTDNNWPGETRTCGDVARTVRSGPRAVGNACGHNPLPIVVPCRRIVAAGGPLGGWSGPGGAEGKQFLLALGGRVRSGRRRPSPVSLPDSPVCLPLFRRV